MHCTVIVYVDDLLVTCTDEATISEVIEALKVKYHDVQEHMGVKHSYLRMTLDMSEVVVCSITMPMFIAELLKDVELGSVVTPASSTLFMINESSPPLDEISFRGSLCRRILWWSCSSWWTRRCSPQ